MIKDNNRIQESKRIIKEEKKKIKREKKILRKKKLNKFKKTKIGKFIYTLSDDRNSYSFSELFIITIISLLVECLEYNVRRPPAKLLFSRSFSIVSIEPKNLL